MRTSESTEIVTQYIPKLINEGNIPIENIKTDCTAVETGAKRIDIMISDVRNNDENFEDKLITLIEVKQSSAIYLDIYDDNGQVKETINNLIKQNLELYERESKNLKYGSITKKGEKDWFNALVQGLWKARKLKLSYFGVSNIKTTVFYHTNTLERIKLKRNVEKVDNDIVKTEIIVEELRGIPTFILLSDLKEKITKSSAICDYSIDSVEEQNEKTSMTEHEFIDFLNNIHNLFYKDSLKGSKQSLGDVILSFIFFKHLEERVILQKREEEFSKRGIKLWSQWLREDNEDTDCGKQIYDIIFGEVKSLCNRDDIVNSGDDYEYGYPQEYREFDSVLMDEKKATYIEAIPRNRAGYDFVYKIYKGLNGYNISTGKRNHSLYLHACNFDVYGAIYEKFKDPKEKEELGQYYTKRHISKILANLLLRPYIIELLEEISLLKKQKNKLGSNIDVNDLIEKILEKYKTIRIIDPSCGTGGLLTECFSFLEKSYVSILGKKNVEVSKLLSENMFSGLDIKDDLVKKSKLNMFFAGDGHTQLYQGDSLEHNNSPIIKLYDDCDKNKWNIIVSNPPFGKGKEYLFIEKYVKAVSYGGRIGIIIPNGVLENPSREDFRKMLISNIKIESIISLNKYVFAPYTQQKTYILIGYKRDKNIIDEINNNFIEDGMKNYNKENISFEEIKDKIWCYILDYDGYNLSDNRWPTDLIMIQEGIPQYIHNDIPELLNNYLEGEIIKENQIHIDGNYKGKYKNGKYLLKKSGFFTINGDINKDNYYNLLPEFYMRPYTPEYITQKELADARDSIIQTVKNAF